MNNTQLRPEAAKGSQILIGNGRLLDPFDLQPDDIDVWALCKSMAKLNRYTGHTLYPYSVAQHTYLLAQAVPKPLRRAALVHDMSEPLMGCDVARPVKRRLPDFTRLEEEIQRVLFDHFGIPWSHMEELYAYDTNICTDEMLVLFDPPYDTGRARLGVKIEAWDWTLAADLLFQLCLENDIV